MASTRDIKFKVIVDEDVKGARKAADALDDVGDKAEHAGHQVSGFGRDLNKLDAEIAASKAALKSLGREFIQTGDKATMKAFRAEGSKLRGLESVGKALKDSADEGEQAIARLSHAAHAGEQSISMAMEHAHGVIQKAMAVYQGLPLPIKIPVTIAVAGLAATGIAAAGGAITGALGLGGIATGIAMQLRDPEVQSEIGNLGQRIVAMFTSSSAGFGVQVRHGLAVLNEEVDRLAPKFASIFGSLQTYVGPLVQGAAKGIEGLVDGIDRAMTNVGPVMTEISADFGSLGRTIGDAFDIMAGGSRGGAAALHSVVRLIEQIITGTAQMIRGFEDFYGKATQANDRLASFESKWLGWLPIVGGDIKKAANEAHGLANSTNAASLATDDLKGSTKGLTNSERDLAQAQKRNIELFDDMFGTMMSLDQANLAYQKDILDLAASVRENGTSLDATTEAGNRNRSMLLNAVNDIKATREANLRNGDSVDLANRKYQDQIASLEATMVKMGFTRGEIDALISKYQEIPRDIYTTVHFEYDKGSYGGIGGIGAKGYAAGGPVSGGVPIMVGEKGPEIFVPSTNGTIVPNAATSTGGRSTAGEQVIHLILEGSGVLTGLRKEIRIRGGNVQTVLGSV